MMSWDSTVKPELAPAAAFALRNYPNSSALLAVLGYALASRNAWGAIRSFLIGSYVFRRAFHCGAQITLRPSAALEQAV